MKRYLRSFLILAWMLVLHPAFAQSPQAVLELRLQRFKAEFVEVWHGRNGGKLEEARGTVYFSYPDKYRCVYGAPQEHVIVADGRHVWTYTEQSDRVIKSGMDKAPGSCPPALALWGSVGRLFDIHNGESENGLQRFVGKERSGNDTLYRGISIGLAGDVIQVVELQDIFGGRMVIRYSNQEINPVLDDELFHFVVPVRAETGKTTIGAD